MQYIFLFIVMLKIVLSSSVEPILLHGNESTAISKVVRNSVSAAEVRFQGRTSRTPWTQEVKYVVYAIRQPEFS